MTSLTWISALALMVAAPTSSRIHCNDGSFVSADEQCRTHGGIAKADNHDSPARESMPPTQRAEDRPAHESPYSAFGAPQAKTPGSQRHRHTGARLECKDGTHQTEGQRKGDKMICDGHGGVKE
jgi:hypothetical protein